MALAWGLLAVQPLAAQVAPGAWPRCIAERDGQQLGLAGSVCECGHDPGGTMTGRPPGWRWSCDLMRSDGDQLEVPADVDRQPSPDLTYSPTYGPADTPQDATGGAPELPAPRYQAEPGRPTALFDGRRRQRADDPWPHGMRHPGPQHPGDSPQPCCVSR